MRVCAAVLVARAWHSCLLLRVSEPPQHSIEVNSLDTTAWELAAQVEGPGSQIFVIAVECTSQSCGSTVRRTAEVRDS